MIWYTILLHREMISNFPFCFILRFVLLLHPQPNLIYGFFPRFCSGRSWGRDIEPKKRIIMWKHRKHNAKLTFNRMMIKITNNRWSGKAETEPDKVKPHGKDVYRCSMRLTAPFKRRIWIEITYEYYMISWNRLWPELILSFSEDECLTQASLPWNLNGMLREKLSHSIHSLYSN